MPNLSVSNLVENVYEMLGADDFDRRPWTIRQVGYALNDAIERARAMGIKVQAWQAAAITLVPGTYDYLYTHAPVAGAGSATVSALEIVAVRRTSDGQYLGRLSPSQLDAQRTGSSTGSGPPEFYSPYTVIETGVASGTDSAKLRLRVHPPPATADTLDLLVRGAEGILFTTLAEGFSEAAANNIDLPDNILIALQRWTAGRLAETTTPEKLAELNLAPNVGSTFIARAEAVFSEEASRLYLEQCSDDIVQVER